ncbi:uncharacterized protein LOC114328743 isoform X1 [Diabrotica virgifera virgifera]|uniref:Uncharacterized protein n=1 Tax=Diabrotica virgifera virgifera TaxID=50390 RepID=A0ABM5IIC9_DIAVI|nr:uncharacterized protein LOC114328743 isoform X1 [Diabrotica virgifera virgifera]
MDDKDLLNSENISEDTHVLNHLENGAYLSSNNIPVSEVVEKVSEFSNFLNSKGRLSLLHANPAESQELVPLMLSVKKNIKSALSEIGQSQIKKIRSYVCPKCDETIKVPPYVDNWTYFQDHEHFEELYVSFLEGSLTISTAMEIEPRASTSGEYLEESDLLDNEHTDSGIDYEEGIRETLSEDEEEPLGSNTFRFNFKPQYDPVVESTLYPDSFKSLKKFDSCQYLCIQKVNSYRAFCLLCCCDLVTKNAAKRISVKHCINHVLGQRHTKACSDELCAGSLEKYHQLFYNLELPYQAHQVYFTPKTLGSLECRLCCTTVQHKNLIEHVQGRMHKNIILDLFKSQKLSEYYLMEHHLSMYGINTDKLKPKDSPAKDNPEKKPRERREKSKSTSGNEAAAEVEHMFVRTFPFPPTGTPADFIPNRYAEHIKYFKDKDTHFGCEACNVYIKMDRADVKNHILSERHQKSSQIKTPKYKYLCEPCSVHLRDENDWDKHFKKPEQRHSKQPQSRLDKFAEYECTTCKYVIFGDEISTTRHKVKAGGKREKPSEPKLTDEIKNLFKSTEDIEEECERLMANNALMSLQKTKDCTKRIEEVLLTVLAECKAYPFGSRESGLGNDKSDLDLYIDVGGMYYGAKNQDALFQAHIVKQVESILSKHRTEFSRIVTVPGARTPIVKVHHISTGIDCDLSFRHGLSVENTKFLKKCLEIQPITQPFILILKKWLQFTQMSEHVTTYALAMLVIFYLQVNGYLLSVEKLNALNPLPAPVISGWKTIKYTASLELLKSKVTQYSGSVVPLLKGFFKYYASFNYFDDAVCPLLGHTIQRKLFQDPRRLPPEMKSYVKQLREKEPEQFRYLSPFCIQDPFDLSHNLTKACQGVSLTVFKKYCTLTHEYLSKLE